jgi:hypothetical protein
MTGTVSLCAVGLFPGSFDFTPEGYAKGAFWMPKDAFTWDDLVRLGPFPTIDECEKKRAEFKAKVSGKFEIIKQTYQERSLRSLLPDRWCLSYDRDTAWIKTKGDSYCQRKHTLYFKSIILGYGTGPIQRATPSKDLATYIKEHCASSARLKAIALRAYESVANIMGFHTWTERVPPVFLALTAAASSLDSMATVLWALLFNESPCGRDIPDMASLYRRLCPDFGRKGAKRLPFGDEFLELYKSKWFVKLRAARDEVIHRGRSLKVHDKFGAAFDFDLGMFKDMQPGLHSHKSRMNLDKKMRRIHLDKIMREYVTGLEKWEKKHSAKLASLACYPSYMTDGILLGIEFWDSNLAWDGSGPNHSVESHSPEFMRIQIERARRAQYRSRTHR